jgi:AcrR family transcriptional regulator
LQENRKPYLPKDKKPARSQRSSITKISAKRRAEKKGAATPSRKARTSRTTTQLVILDAAEKLMLAEGYAAVSTRRVANEAGLKAPLVHYYFPTTDDLLLAVLRRTADQVQAELDQALASKQPLRALWLFASDSSRTALAMEFMALANHRKVIRSEIALSTERTRRRQAEALSMLTNSEVMGFDALPPVGVTVLMAGIARALVLEGGVGISLGHAEVRKFIDWWLCRLEKPSV